MTTISQFVDLYIAQPRLKGKLLIEINVNDGTFYPIGTESDLLIYKGEGMYHFEADNTAVIVSRDEIEFVE